MGEEINTPGGMKDGSPLASRSADRVNSTSLFPSVGKESESVMCVSCGQELCKSCHECHNEECERYVPPSNTCEITKDALRSILTYRTPDKRTSQAYFV